jgi:5,6-dimethylbenzimidazole synthase
VEKRARPANLTGKEERLMDIFAAMKERRSCRDFLPEPVGIDKIEKLLEAASWAPSPLNLQPWQFVVVTSKDVKERLFSEAKRCISWALDRSGWEWLKKYNADFLQTAPVIIAVVGDPKKTGVDMFLEEGGVGYQHACAAAIQNMNLAAYSLGLSSLWFTFFEKEPVRKILGITPDKTPIALICIGKSNGQTPPVRRNDVMKKTIFIT